MGVADRCCAPASDGVARLEGAWQRPRALELDAPSCYAMGSTSASDPTETNVDVTRMPSGRILLRGATMAALGNLIWFLCLGGFFLGLGWLIAGVILCITVVGIPFGQACFRISSFAFFPFGKD